MTDSLSHFAIQVLSELFYKGASWDGDIVSKTGRDELLKKGLAVRHEGWTILTVEGLKWCLALGWGG